MQMTNWGEADWQIGRSPQRQRVLFCWTGLQCCLSMPERQTELQSLLLCALTRGTSILTYDQLQDRMMI